MSESKLRELSREFYVDIIELAKHLKFVKESIISNQIGRSGTSIGANIHEAKHAHSRPDFVAKLQIALKECYETEYQIEIAQKANIISADTTKPFCTIAAQYAECSFPPSTQQRKMRNEIL